VIAAGLHFGLVRTRFGARLRAAVDDQVVARAMGLPVPAIFSATFALGSGLAGLGGALGGSTAVIGAAMASSGPPSAAAGPAAPRALDHDTAADRLKVLATVELLRGLTTDERAALADALVLRRAAAGQPVVQHGEAGDSMFVIVEGALGVHVPGPGEAQRANVLGPGSVFGEMAMLTGEARSATVQALGPVLLYEIGRDQMADYAPRRGVDLQTAERLLRPNLD